MAKNLSVRVDNSCHENWHRMTPAGESRFCASCQRSVTDFTGMTDQEIIAWLTSHPGPVCGRFEPGQLNRALSNPPERQRKIAPWHFLLAGLLASADVTAQQMPANTLTVHSDTSSRSGGTNSHLQNENTQPSIMDANPIISSTDTIRGQILDEDNQPVPFASVTYDKDHGTHTDAKGNFVLPIRKLQGKHVLTVSSVGYQSKEVPIKMPTSKSGSPAANGEEPGQILVKLTLSHAEMGIVVVATKRKNPIVQILRDTLASIGFGAKPLSIYPNPVERGASISVDLRFASPGTYTLRLFTIEGTLVESQEVEGNQRSKHVLMNIPATLTPGNYFIRLSHATEKGVYTRQLVIL